MQIHPAPYCAITYPIALMTHHIQYSKFEESNLLIFLTLLETLKTIIYGYNCKIRKAIITDIKDSKIYQNCFRILSFIITVFTILRW